MQLLQNSIDLFYDTIEAYDKITIYRHISPDADALGAQMGLKHFLLEKYPHKEVKALGFQGNNFKNYVECMDEASDEFIKNSLGIILDVSTIARVDDNRVMDCLDILVIDHHLDPENFRNKNIIYNECGAACELLTLLIKARNESINKRCAEYLYSGLIGDTLRFSIPATTSSTLHAAAYLVDNGVDVAKINELNFSSSLKHFKYENYLKSNLEIVDDCFAYKIVSKAEYEQFDLPFQEAKEKVFVFSGVHEFEGWALFTEKEVIDGVTYYVGSLRSKSTTITEIARRYNGGGHRFACGVRGLTREDIKALISELVNKINENRA